MQLLAFETNECKTAIVLCRCQFFADVKNKTKQTLCKRMMNGTMNAVGNQLINPTINLAATCTEYYASNNRQ